MIGLGVLVFNATFNNISVISWRSILLIEEIGEYMERTTRLQQVTDKLYHINDNIVSGTPCRGWDSNSQL